MTSGSVQLVSDPECQTQTDNQGYSKLRWTEKCWIWVDGPQNRVSKYQYNILLIVYLGNSDGQR